jgi:transcriptional regulator with XRE-family HTH domain
VTVTAKQEQAHAAALAAAVIELREKKGYTGRSFAREAELSQGVVWRLDHGQMRWTLALLLRVSDALGLKPSALLRKCGL